VKRLIIIILYLFLSSCKRIFRYLSSRTHSRSFVKDCKCYVQGAILFSKLTTLMAPVHPYHGGISLLRRGYQLSLSARGGFFFLYDGGFGNKLVVNLADNSSALALTYIRDDLLRFITLRYSASFDG